MSGRIGCRPARVLFVRDVDLGQRDIEHMEIAVAYRIIHVSAVPEPTTVRIPRLADQLVVALTCESYHRWT